MSQESEPKKKEPPREKPEALEDAAGNRLPAPAEAPALRENSPAGAAPASAPPKPKSLIADRLKVRPANPELARIIQVGLAVLIFVALFTLAVSGLRSAFRNSGSSGVSGPEAVVRRYFEAVKKGDADTAMACVDWDKLLLQAWGREFTRMNDAQKVEALDRQMKIMKRKHAEGGEFQRRTLDNEMRILQVVTGVDVAEVRILSMSRQTGEETEASIRLEKDKGDWKIYRFPGL